MPSVNFVRVSPMKIGISRGPSDCAASVSTTMVIDIARVAIVIIAVRSDERKPDAEAALPL